MSRIAKYQVHIREFLKNKSFVKNTRRATQRIIYDMLKESNLFPSILCLTIINNRCKQGNIQMHGYHLASGVEAMMMITKILSNYEYYEQKYSKTDILNMISDVTNWFYNCITENIKTLKFSNDERVNAKQLLNVTTKCIEYAAKNVCTITEQKIFKDYSRMKKTDLFCVDFEKEAMDNYKHMRRLDKDTIMQNIRNSYGIVCRLAVCLGWLIAMGDQNEQTLQKLEALADSMSMMIKLYDDFTTYKRDMRCGKLGMNYILSHGIKDALILWDDAKLEYTGQSLSSGVETKTCNEIIKVIAEKITDATEGMSVDLDTEYDDVTIATNSYASQISITEREISIDLPRYSRRKKAKKNQ